MIFEILISPHFAFLLCFLFSFQAAFFVFIFFIEEYISINVN